MLSWRKMGTFTFQLLVCLGTNSEKQLIESMIFRNFPNSGYVTLQNFDSSPLKMMVGRRFFSFGFRPIFRGKLLNFRGVSVSSFVFFCLKPVAIPMRPNLQARYHWWKWRGAFGRLRCLMQEEVDDFLLERKKRNSRHIIHTYYTLEIFWSFNMEPQKLIV